MNENLKNFSLHIAVVVASLILGICVLVSAKLISRSMENASASLRRDLLKEIKALQPTNEKKFPPKENVKPGEKRVEGVTAGTSPIKGNMSAPVLMVEFSDLECPFSKRFYQGAFPQIDNEYIATGKVKFAYRDFPLPFHPFAKDAAIALRCSGKQNKYWQMFDKLSRNERIDPPAIEGYAKDVGLNVSSFNSCLKDDAVRLAVENDSSEALKLGVQGTPAFFINGRFIPGALPFEMFKEIIEEELGNPGNKK